MHASQRGALLATVFLVHLGTAAHVPALPVLREEFLVSAATVSLITAVYGLSRLVFDLPVGMLLERMPRGPLLLAGTLLSLAGSMVAAVAPTFEILLIGRAVSGAGTAVFSITAIVGLIAATDPRRRGRTMGR